MQFFNHTIKEPSAEQLETMGAYREHITYLDEEFRAKFQNETNTINPAMINDNMRYFFNILVDIKDSPKRDELLHTLKHVLNDIGLHFNDASSQTGRDFWMQLGFYYVENNVNINEELWLFCEPNIKHDDDQENLFDYFVSYFPKNNRTQNMLDFLLERISVQWWQELINSSWIVQHQEDIKSTYYTDTIAPALEKKILLEETEHCGVVRQRKKI